MSASHLRFVRTVRLARALRGIRVMRLLRYVSALRTLVLSIMSHSTIGESGRAWGVEAKLEAKFISNL